MGVQRPAERHYVRRRPPPEREAERWVPLAGPDGRTFWLDVELWLRPVPIRDAEGIPEPLKEAVESAARQPAKPGSSAPFVRFLHEPFFYELTPAAVGLAAADFSAAAPQIAAALREAGCEYVETEE